MKITKNSYVSISYKLTVGADVVEDVKADAPLEFIFGTGMLLPKFEENLNDKSVGDKFGFTLTPAESYGEYIDEAIVELPKDVFIVDGEFNEEIIRVGAVLPMMDNEGNPMYGTVESINESTVKMNFNHPMAGKTLVFEGEVVGVREATDDDMARFMPQDGGCSCGCGDGGCDDCDSEKSCGSDCGCN